MALANYSDLKEAAEKWSRRSDIKDILDDAIDLAETEIYKHLRLRDMEARATAALDSATPSRFLALPDKLIEMRRLLMTVDDKQYELPYKPPLNINVRVDTGTPCFFTVTSQLEFDIQPDQAYVVEMQYIKELTRLSAANPTNQILTRFPDIYLNGTLYAIFDSVRNEELAEYRFNKMMQAIKSANKQDRKGRYGPAPYIGPIGPTP